jgi:hypothetical protein
MVLQAAAYPSGQRRLPPRRNPRRWQASRHVSVAARDARSRCNLRSPPHQPRAAAVTGGAPAAADRRRQTKCLRQGAAHVAPVPTLCRHAWRKQAATSCRSCPCSRQSAHRWCMAVQGRASRTAATKQLRRHTWTLTAPIHLRANGADQIHHEHVAGNCATVGQDRPLITSWGPLIGDAGL